MNRFKHKVLILSYVYPSRIWCVPFISPMKNWIKIPKKEKKKRVKLALCSSVDVMDSSSAAPEDRDKPPSSSSSSSGKHRFKGLRRFFGRMLSFCPRVLRFLQPCRIAGRFRSPVAWSEQGFTEGAGQVFGGTGEISWGGWCWSSCAGVKTLLNAQSLDAHALLWISLQN